MADDYVEDTGIRFCPDGHPSDDLGQCNVVWCTWADPSVKPPAKRGKLMQSSGDELLKGKRRRK